jgi:hypothetical protein
VYLDNCYSARTSFFKAIFMLKIYSIIANFFFRNIFFDYFICGLFNDDVSCSDYIASTGTMIKEDELERAQKRAVTL